MRHSPRFPLRKIPLLLAAVFFLPACAGLVGGAFPAAQPNVPPRGGAPSAIEATAEPFLLNVYEHEADKVSQYDLESYMVGVLAGEMPASYEIEALKAQAVAGRSYILDRVENCRQNGAPPEHKGADLCTNPAHCKAWLSEEAACAKWGEEWRAQSLPRLRQAVRETQGEYMIYDGAAVKAFFYSLSSGRTETAHDVWGGADYPYLQSVESAGDCSAPDFESVVTVPADEFLRKLKEQNAAVVRSEPLSAMIGTASQTEGGAVATVLLGGQPFRGTQVRALFGLRSANFTIEAGEDCVVFRVRGYGHGVGMSQYGANEMAKQGKTYREILQHYYTGVDFSMLNYQN